MFYNKGCAAARGLSEFVRRSLAHFVTVWSLKARAHSSDTCLLVVKLTPLSAPAESSINSHICHRHARAGGGAHCDTQRPARRFPGRRCRSPPPKIEQRRDNTIIVRAPGPTSSTGPSSERAPERAPKPHPHGSKRARVSASDLASLPTAWCNPFTTAWCSRRPRVACRAW